MSTKFTPEQSAAIQAKGKVIVSASAGSGKTTVMIKKVVDYVVNGGDLDELLAVTFTKKAAAQMKEKLRKELIKAYPEANDEQKANIKYQLSKIPSADISTIHSFCSHLLRTYFYAIDIDSSFDIMAESDADAKDMKARVIDDLFDELYDAEDENFLYVLSKLRRNRSDDGVKKLVFEAYNEVRNVCDYEALLAEYPNIYCDEGFDKVCLEYKKFANDKCKRLMREVEDFSTTFKIDGENYYKILSEMVDALQSVIDSEDLFAPLPKLHDTAKPRANEDTKEDDEIFVKFRDKIKEKYNSLFKEVGTREVELAKFLESGRLATAFTDLLLKFDKAYTAIKLDEGKLEYGDLEHLTLKLLKNEEVKKQINAKYKYVFVDEYQDVNPVQETILNAVGAHDSFTVGDVKQAIYGFRGSKSVFFSQKFKKLDEGDGVALKLSSNFRSSDGVVNFVNELFSDMMTRDICGFDYKKDNAMVRGAAYPDGYGDVHLNVFGSAKPEEEESDGIYSVLENASAKKEHSAEGLAVLKIIKEELSKPHFDIDKGEFVDTQPGDICILSKKRANASISGIVRTLTDYGYSVTGTKDTNICTRSEVKEMLDILSYIDNSQQDIPLVTALLSPLGSFTYDELAKIRITFSGDYGERPPFRECAITYAKTLSDDIAYKLSDFFIKINSYKKLSDVIGAGKLIDRICEDCGFSISYSFGTEKMASIKRLREEAYGATGELSLNAFLAKIKAGGYNISAPAPSASDSIKVMTMHASKGLEFPIVIIADAASSFMGEEYSELPFDDEFGFAPKCYDKDSMTYSTTVLRRLCDMRSKRENVKNEMNLFYVACTRAKCTLHIMMEKVEPFDRTEVLSADRYTKLSDFSLFPINNMVADRDFVSKEEEGRIISSPDEETYAKIKALFNKKYENTDSVDLPVKSSASRILQLNKDDEAPAENVLFPEEKHDKGNSGAERGTAYHRFLELCDFSVKDEDGIEKQIHAFVQNGAMDEAQAELLKVENLVKILSMPVFDELKDATCYREREFICKLPASDFLDTDAQDGVIVQGAIDLLAIAPSGVKIIDYKFSVKSDEEVVAFYAPQLALYKKVVAKILKVDENAVSTTIVNIRSLHEIPLV